MIRCELCPNIHKCLPPDGPKDSDLLFILEAPGFDEEKQGRILVGKTSQETDQHYFPLAGLRRPDVRIINSIACLPPGSKGKIDINKPKDLALLQSCAEAHLYPEIRCKDYTLLIPCGAFACYAVDPTINLELDHGIPRETKWGTVFPMRHPSAGVHLPKQMTQIRTDWIKLRRYLNGRLSVRVDEFPNTDYSEVVDIEELDSVDPTQPIACDTESSARLGPYCLTYSQYPGTGRLIKAERTDLLERFQAKLNEWESVILFHNWLYDWNVTLDMRLEFPYKNIVDTMVMAYHLGNVPQGLKALAYRELGMRMQDFTDLVTPYSTQVALRYFHDASALDWPKPEAEMIRGVDGKWKVYQPQAMTTKFKRLFTDYRKNPAIDLFERWDNWEDSQKIIEDRCGKFVGLDIADVPFDEVLEYAVKDADATLRIWSVLEKMKKSCHEGKMQEQWRM